ncbi:hypothetical protein GCM10027445_06550 [Amycolatopsis endophytica]|uniref:AcrR family transcriptional regulator n=1 Tax=Amycolatopsis endophytica TaxID=860233 RepID=A0A853AW12_9PSEU|nr:TetR/AcrR family transcriptional regulator [Amycolatopsis endophytica]NYI86893.1 AcrR family transcriptional regulator [Amycolatopsis endophytica]
MPTACAWRSADWAEWQDERITTKRRAPAPEERQRDAERTKGRIVDAAVAEFSAKGFAGARVSEIARRAGVNQQLIAYCFDSKEGLYREIGRRWRAREAAEFPENMDFAELIRGYVKASVDPALGGRLLAWDGLADTGEDDPERDARLRQEVELARRRQEAGELDERLDPAALVLMSMGSRCCPAKSDPSADFAHGNVELAAGNAELARHAHAKPPPGNETRPTTRTTPLPQPDPQPPRQPNTERTGSGGRTPGRASAHGPGVAKRSPAPPAAPSAKPA